MALFGSGGVNLFEQCAHLFNSQASGNRAFPLPQSLLLYAVLLHSIRTTEDFPYRLRVVRNLIAASEYEVRRANMPALLTDVEAVIVRGDLDAVTRFRGGQVHDEQLKRAFLAAHPDLAEAVFRLEDHPILRGTLLAFDLDPATFRHRAQAFEAAFADPDTWQGLTGALLATGDYQRLRPGTSAWQFGTSRPGNESVWRYLLTETTHEALASTRRVLGEFLDQFPDDGSDPTAHHQAVIDAFVTRRQEADTYDWRYHLVRYPEMRSGKTGIYYGVDGHLGYSLVMMRTKQLNGYYRDPILLQVWKSSGVGDQVEDPWFTGYETTARWLRLTRSGVRLRSITQGFEIQGPDRPEYETPFRDVCARRADILSHGSQLLLAIPQRDSDGGLVDTVDRVLVGAALLRELVEAGL